MKYHHISGRINTEALESLYEFLNNTEDTFTVTLSSHGGQFGIGKAIVDALNERSADCSLHVVDCAYSAALDIFLGFKGLKTVEVGCTGLMHQSTISGLTIFENGKPDVPTKAKYQIMTYIQKWALIRAQMILTDTELEQYKRGEDICLHYPRMKKLCKIYI